MGMGCSVDKNAASHFQCHEAIPRLKIALVGDPQVGKTSIFMRYLKNQFSTFYVPTKKPSIENIVKKVNVPSHTIVSLTLWDIPGREDIFLYRTYFTDLDAAIVVVDLTDESTIELAVIWRQIILNNAFKTCQETGVTKGGQLNTGEKQLIPVDKENFPVLLLGNKYDVIEQRILTEELARKGVMLKADETSLKSKHKEIVVEKPEVVKYLERTAKEHGFMGSVMVSALDPDGTVDAAVNYLTRHLLESKYKLSKWKGKEKKDVKKKDQKKHILQRTGLQKFDEIFESGEDIIQRLEGIDEDFRQALLKFKKSCIQYELVEGTENSSLEKCVVGLRTSIADQTVLQVAEDDGLCSFITQPKLKELNISIGVKVVLQYFNTKVLAAAKIVLKEAPQMTASIEELEAKVADLCELSWEDIISSSEREDSSLTLDRRQLSNQVEENRAVMKHGSEQGRKAEGYVKESMDSIRSAQMW